MHHKEIIKFIYNTLKKHRFRVADPKAFGGGLELFCKLRQNAIKNVFAQFVKTF